MAKAKRKTAKKAARKTVAKKAARKAPTPKKAAKKTARKVTAKKATRKPAAKKAARKPIAKKAAPKKAVRKPAAKKAAPKKAARKPAPKKAARKATAKKGKYVYFFGGGKADGGGTQKNLLGGKGANLAEMNRIGLPVPAGLTITTEVCSYYYDNGKKYPATLDAQIDANIAKIEKVMGKKFGDLDNPLLLSVRSGARESMPGMMDTILNLGINDQVVESLSEKTGNPKFAWDSYRRFLQMYGSVVMGVEAEEGEHHDPYEVILEKAKKNAEVQIDSELSEADLRWVVAEFKALIKERSGSEFPEDPREQLMGSVNAVFNSWNNDRAKVYRQKYGIPAAWGTAVNVQAMVFGNTGSTSGTGVALLVTLPQVKMFSTVSIWLMPKVRTWLPVFAHRSLLPKCPKTFLSRMLTFSRSARCLRLTSKMCRTLSSPSKTGNSGCCRLVTESAPGLPL